MVPDRSSNNHWLLERGVTIENEWARLEGDLGPGYDIFAILPGERFEKRTGATEKRFC